MTRNIFTDFENNREHTIELLDNIDSAVCLFTVSSEIKFLHFNRFAEELLGYGSGQLMEMTADDPTKIFAPEYVDRLYSEIIASMRQGQAFNYNCQLLCGDGSYKWTNIGARLVQQKNGTLYFQSVFTPIREPDNMQLQGFHALIAMGDNRESEMITQLIEHYGGTCNVCSRGLDAIDKFESSEDGFYQCVFIGCRMKDINGFEMAKDVRHADHPQAKSIPLLLITENNEVVEEAVDVGITAYMRKPISPKKMRTWFKTLNKS